MINFLENQILFYISVAIVLFLPGYAFFTLPKIKENFSALERFVFSFGASIIFTDILMLLMGALHISITRLNLILVFVLFFASIGTAKFFLKKKNPSIKTIDINWSKKELSAIVVILLLTIFIKTAFLSDAVFPTSTDLGHHMYWAKSISEIGKIPVYQEQDIIKIDSGYAVSQPEKIADFIVGEHLIFGAIGILSGMDYQSAFPIIILFAINLLGILSSFVLTLKLFENHPHQKRIAISVLLFLGPLYAISSAQAKFVSGGVIGNLIGNFLIPVVLYFLYRTLAEKNIFYMLLTGLFAFGLFYTHHLSSFVFIFVVFFSVIFFTLFNFKNILSHIQSWLKLFFNKYVLLFIACCVLFIVFIYTPTYLNTSAVDTAVGSPVKSTRTGLLFSQLTYTTGEARMALGIVGLFMLFLFRRFRASYSQAILLGWTVAIMMMSMRPQWLFVDIPSARIANYLAYPLAILGAYAFSEFIAKSFREKSQANFSLPSVIFTLVIIFAFISGSYDNASSLKTENNTKKALETINASKYLGSIIGSEDIILKDHNFITADAWIKLSFMRGYNFPFSRGLFKRYEDITKEREMCTLWMISTPNSADAQKCFDGTKTDFLMVNPTYDSEQFTKSNNFDRIYSSDNIAIFHKINPAPINLRPEY